MKKRALLAVTLVWALGTALEAQEHGAPAEAATPSAQTAAPDAHAADAAAPARPGPSDIIMPHITDSKHLEFPWVYSWGNWAGHVTLPTWNVTIFGRTVDLGPTKHVVYLLLAAIIVAVLLVGTARAHARHTHAVGRPRGAAAGLEGVMLYLRNEIYMPVIGHGGERYIPFCLTLFFFIAIANLLGLVPYGSTPTGNIAVTLTLVAITFVVVEIAGMRALGKGYISTIVYWPHDMPLAMKLPLTVVMTPVELIGKFTKPFALTIRLFANMIAGHVIILALIGLIFMFGALAALAAIPMALFIMFLELLVVFIQAFIFSLLAAVFIGQIRAAHH